MTIVFDLRVILCYVFFMITWLKKSAAKELWHLHTIFSERIFMTSCEKHENWKICDFQSLYVL